MKHLKRKLTLAIFPLLLATSADASLIYRTGTNSSSFAPSFNVYDTVTGTWTAKAALPGSNTTQLAADNNTVYALTEDANIYSYNALSDSWIFHLAGPTAALGRHAISMFEIDANGDFYWGEDGTTTLHYTSGGSWASINTPETISSGSDIDVVNNELLIRTYQQAGFFTYDIGAQLFGTNCNSSTAVGENGRIGGYYDGNFYSAQFNGGNLLATNTTTCVEVDTGVALNVTHSSMDISDDGLIYLNGYSNTNTLFEVYDIANNTLTSLTNAPNCGSGDHCSIAYVSGQQQQQPDSNPIPEPASLGLLLAGMLGLRLRKRSA